MPRLIDHLDGLYVSTLERVELLRCACAASAPDPAQLSSARLGLMAVSAKRSRFLHDEVYPLLIAASVAAFGARPSVKIENPSPPPARKAFTVTR